MSVKRLKIAAFLVLANYVLALTVGGSFHFHGDRRCARDSGHSATVCLGDLAEPCGGHPSDDSACCAYRNPAAEGSLLGLPHSEKCPVCQFLAKKPVPGRSVEAVACTELVETWVPVKPLRLAESFPSTHPIRGPPAVV